jgi:sulfite exporter TauE/SafE
MTCKSCEVLIESRWRALPGITRVHVDAHRGVAYIAYTDAAPSRSDLADALEGTKYRIDGDDGAARRARPSAARLLGAIVVALGIALLFTKFGFFNGVGSLASSIGIGAAFVLGLIAATSSCVATVGGLMITAVTQYQRTIRIPTLATRVLPVAAFVIGRVLSYGLLGGLLGAAGAAFSPSPTVTGAIVIVAALYMIVMGLDMLGIAPAFLKALMPHMPKAFSHWVMNVGTSKHRGLLSSFLLGAATFFIPCGFTQGLQIYALTTGSFWTSGLILGAFALGTAPVLGLLGFSLASFSLRARDFVFQCAGALVLFMGVWNIQNGLTITGHPLNTSWLKSARPVQAETKALKQDAYVFFDGTEQIVRMKADYSGYTPSRFTIRAGVPTRWQIDGTKASGCVSAFQVPSLGIRRILQSGINEISFVAPLPGQYVYSCSMGMYRGVINVIPNS